ncbi:MAG: PilT/PilU family type 4a pilus ATPase [Acidobacteriota bacterium]
MSDLPPDGLFGRIAVHYGLITREQLAEATRIQSREGSIRPLGQIFVDEGWIDDARRMQLLKVQREYIAKEAAAAPAAPAPAAIPAPPASPPTPGPTLTASEEVLPSIGEELTEGAPAPALDLGSPTPSPAAAPTPAASTPSNVSPPRNAGEPRSLLEILEHAVAAGASDVHLHSGATVRLRQSGVLKELSSDRLEESMVQAHLDGLLSDEHLQQLADAGQVDGAYSLPGVGRFRINAYRQQHGVDAVLRIIPASPPTLAELNLPQQLAQFTNYHQGLVLVTGPAGCGKSATMAALINLVNEERLEHVITGEDPIEIIHPSKSCLVNQRQVGTHSDSFAKVLRAALREDPDVIALGDLRDLETISLALSAAETGHLVFATMHTGSATQTVNRLIGAFPPTQQDQIRVMVSESLRAIISQRLVAKSDGSGRVPALEILVANRAVGNLIRENKTFQIESIMQTGSAQGMLLLDASLKKLVAEGTITEEEAARHRPS